MPAMGFVAAVREKANYIKYCFCKADNKSVDSHYKSGALIKYCRGRRKFILRYIAKSEFL